MGIQHRNIWFWPTKNSINSIGPTKICLLALHLFIKEVACFFSDPFDISANYKNWEKCWSRFSKLSRDFLEIILPQKHKKLYKGTIELGQLAFKKNVVPNGKASLAAIVAATLQKHLSKESRASEWAATTLDDDQKQYAALDAYVALMVWEVLETFDSV